MRRGFIAAACALVCVLLASSPGVSDAAFSANGASPVDGGPIGVAITLDIPPAPTISAGLGLTCAIGAKVTIAWTAPPVNTRYWVYTNSGNYVAGPFATAGTTQISLALLTTYHLRVTDPGDPPTWKKDGPAGTCKLIDI